MRWIKGLLNDSLELSLLLTTSNLSIYTKIEFLIFSWLEVFTTFEKL